MRPLDGRAAIVTGAGRGIGAATALELAKQGVAVILAARTAEQIEAIADEIRMTGGQAFSIAADVSRYTDVVGLVEQCKSRFGRVDILINNAGMIEPIARLASSDPKRWGQAADINDKGVYHGLRAAIPVMVEQGEGVIVNISSGAATGMLEGWSHYCSSKAAVLSLTRYADLEYRDQGIRVVGLSPGTVRTDMQVSIKASGINPISQLDPSVHIPAEWAAKAVAWLCTDDAAEFAGTDFKLGTDEARKRVGLIGQSKVRSGWFRV